MPEDPSGYVNALSLHRYFETVSFTREDAGRADFYTQNARRKEMAAERRTFHRSWRRWR